MIFAFGCFSEAISTLHRGTKSAIFLQETGDKTTDSDFTAPKYTTGEVSATKTHFWYTQPQKWSLTMDDTLLRYKADNSRLKDHIRSLVEGTEGGHTFFDDFKENIHDIRSRNYNLPQKEHSLDSDPPQNAPNTDYNVPKASGHVNEPSKFSKTPRGSQEKDNQLKTRISRSYPNDPPKRSQSPPNEAFRPINGPKLNTSPRSLLLDKLSRQNGQIEELEATVRKLLLQNLQLSDKVHTSEEKLAAANRKLERARLDAPVPKIEPPHQKAEKSENGSEAALRRQLAALQQQNTQLELRNSQLALQNSQLAREAADKDHKLERIRHSVLALQLSYKKAYALNEDLRFMQAYIRRFWGSQTAAVIGQTDNTESLLRHDSTTEVLIRGPTPHAGALSVEQAYVAPSGPPANRLRSAVYAVLFVHRVQKRIDQGGLYD